MNKRNKLSHATSVGNKQKKTEDRKTVFISNIVSIVSSTSKKEDQNEVHAINDLIQFSMSSAYFRKKASTKRGHFIAQFHNTEAKCSIKPCIVQTKKVCKELRQKLVDWITKKSNVRESQIARDTLFITDIEYGVKRRVPKLLLKISM